MSNMTKTPPENKATTPTPQHTAPPRDTAPQPVTPERATQFQRHLRNADVPHALVAPLAPPDLLLLLREADDEQRGDLLLLSSPAQFTGLCDLACWQGDTRIYTALEHLIWPLVQRGVDEARLAFTRLDEELRTLLLRRHVIVHLREDKDDDIPANDDNELIACPDTFYFIELVSEGETPDVVRGLLQGMLTLPYETYQKELECVRHDMTTELEELALRWRNNRLADLGFATREEGLRLLSQRPAAPLIQQLESAAMAPVPAIDIDVPALYQHTYRDAALLDAAIQHLRQSSVPQHQQRAAQLPAELTAATNMLLSALDCDLSDFDAIARHIALSRDLVCLGLSALHCDTPDTAAHALAHLLPGQLMQAAMGVLAPLRDRARELLRHPALTLDNDAGAWLDPPHRIALHLLRPHVPAWWAWLTDAGQYAPAPQLPFPKELQPFAHTSQLALAQQLLDEAEQAAALLPKLRLLGPWETTPDVLLAFSSLVMTALANAFAAQRVPTAPVSPSDAQRFAQAFVAIDEDQSLADALAVLAPHLDDATPADAQAAEARTRLLQRALLIGRARLQSLPAHAVIATR